MNDDNLQALLEILNTWWRQEYVSPEVLRARVVLIYKKGDTSNWENYRPISLLNSTYKIYAAIVQKRLASTLDTHLQTTQYGFRQRRSTAQAIH
eukprot:2437486-Pyramimonas_sp.AAC.1